MYSANNSGSGPAARAPDYDTRRSPRQQPLAGGSAAVREPALIRRLASDESWIEVASQPSSSSMSSAAPDEIITTGLRVQNQSVNPRRRRRLHRNATNTSTSTRNSSSLANSMTAADDYSSSESGSDPAAASSSGDDYQNNHRFVGEGVPYEGSDSASLEEEEEDDPEDIQEDDNDSDDENVTALGPVDPSPLFTPQPNAFSHPPSTRLSSNPASTTATTQDSYFPPISTQLGANSTSTAPTTATGTCSSARSAATTSSQQRPRAHVRTRSHTPYTAIAPSHSVPIDHDAALRASLSTLLSCAAAARGLPKRDSVTPEASSSRAQTHRVEPASLRLFSEADMQATSRAGSALPQAQAGTLRQRRLSSSGSSGSAKAHQQHVRKARSPARRLGANRRRAAEAAQGHAQQQVISPTLMTWVLGAGVMVLFSALSFSAGYALGREVGHVEAQAGGAMGAMGAGVVDDGWFGGGGLRSKVWRWGNGSGIRA